MNKKFDCVEMKYKGAEKIRKEVGELPLEDELKFWQDQSRELKNRKNKIIEEHNVIA